jgi:hypothetical protein
MANNLLSHPMRLLQTIAFENDGNDYDVCGDYKAWYHCYICASLKSQCLHIVYFTEWELRIKKCNLSWMVEKIYINKI